MDNYLTLEQLIERLKKLQDENSPSTPTNVRSVGRELYPITHIYVQADN